MSTPLYPNNTSPYGGALDPSWHLVAEFRPSDMMQWAKEYTFGNTATFNDELETYLPANVYIDNTTGDLILEGRNTGGGDPSVSSGKYTSGTVQSWNAASFKYGYVEGKIKMPTGKGVWPAFWMLLTSYDSSDEIDIVEIFETATTLNRGLHYENPPSTKHSDGGSTTVPDMGLTYHYYGLEWTPTAITWFFDGVQIFQVTSATEFPHDVMYILLNVAIGGIVTSGAPNDSQFPLRMHVEYVRLWQRSTNEYTLQLTPQAPAFTNYFAAIMNYGPSYYYRCDETSGTVARDQSGNSHDGSYNGGFTLRQTGLLTGDPDQAVRFNGSTGYIATPFDPTGLTQLSIASRFMMPSVINNDGRFVASSHTDANNNGFEMTISANGAGGLVSVGWGDNRVDCFWSLPNAATLQANTNYSYGFSWDGQYLHVYFAGALVGTASATGSGHAISSSGFNVNIGRGPYNNDYCAVIGDEVAFFPNKVLGAADFAALDARATTSPVHAVIATLTDSDIVSAVLSDAQTF